MGKGWPPGLLSSLKIRRAQATLNSILRVRFDGPRKLKDGRPIIEQREPYKFVTDPPQRIGDEAMIFCGKAQFVRQGRKGRRYLRLLSPPIYTVMLLEAEDGSRWLVRID